MKIIKLFTVCLMFISCATVSVNSDYEKGTDFSKYKTYAYSKEGIDKVEISDLDKKRILRSIDEQMLQKGFAKSETPDFLINIFTKAQKEVAVYGNGWGYNHYPYGYYPYGYYGGYYSGVNAYTEGVLYINFVDATSKELFWQGYGSGYLTEDREEKDAVIRNFVTQILLQYPPKQ